MLVGILGVSAPVRTCWLVRVMLLAVWSSSTVPARLYTLASTVSPAWVVLPRLSRVTVPVSRA
jgi:hypothetical protein